MKKILLSIVLLFILASPGKILALRPGTGGGNGNGGGGGVKSAACYQALDACRSLCSESTEACTAGVGLYCLPCTQMCGEYLIGCLAGCQIGFMNCG